MAGGPGKSFRKGMSLIEVFQMFPDNNAAEEWFKDVRWPDGIECPHCESENIQLKTTHPTMPHRCRSCRKFFSVKTRSVMEGSNLDYQTWAIATYLLTTSLKSVSSMKLHRDLDITQKSAWHLAHRIRETFCDENVELFDGPVEVDETYIGGKRKNMSLSKRRELKEAEVGRGAVGKTAVVGAKDRATNTVAAEVVQSTDAATLQGFVTDHADPDATIYTDDAKAYHGMDFDHESVRHSIGEYVREMAHTNGMESFWSMLKRGYVGTFHKMSPQHLQRYVTEFAGKHNIRDADTISQMQIIAFRMVGKRLKYRDLVS